MTVGGRAASPVIHSHCPGPPVATPHRPTLADMAHPLPVSRARRGVAAGWVGALLLGTAALTGCSSGTPVQPGTVPTTFVPASRTTTAAATTTTTTAVIDVIADMPAAAKAHTKEGAEAFVRHFIDSANRIIQSPVQGQLVRLCKPSSKGCSGLELIYKDYVTRNERLKEPAYAIRAVLAPTLDVSRLTKYDVVVSVDVLPFSRLAADGTTVTAVSGSGVHPMTFHLEWNEDRWTVADFENTQ